MAKPDGGLRARRRRVYDTTLGWRFPNPRMARRFPLESMGETAENVAEKYGIARERAGRVRAALATGARSPPRRRAASRDEIVAGRRAAAKGDRCVVESDESPRADTSLEELAKLKPVFRKGGTVTAGNSSPLNDGAAALLLRRRASAAETGAASRWRASSRAPTAGVDPREMGKGPVPADAEGARARRAVRRRRSTWSSSTRPSRRSRSPCIRELELDPERVNVDGGAIALGHPIGMQRRAPARAPGPRAQGAAAAIRARHLVHRRRARRVGDRRSALTPAAPACSKAVSSLPGARRQRCDRGTDGLRTGSAAVDSRDDERRGHPQPQQRPRLRAAGRAADALRPRLRLRPEHVALRRARVRGRRTGWCCSTTSAPARSDLAAYDPARYATLDGYADDVLEICRGARAPATRSSSGTRSAR